MTVRPGRPADAPALRALQRHLREPSPRLLSLALDGDGVLVDVRDPPPATGADSGPGTAVEPGAGTEVAPGTGAGADAGDPVGYVLAVGGRYAVGDAGAGDLHVAELVVHPDHRREGRATRLLSRLLDRAGGRVTLLVAADADGPRALYDGLGFRRAGRRPDFYDDGTDAVLLARDSGTDAGVDGGDAAADRDDAGRRTDQNDAGRQTDRDR